MSNNTHRYAKIGTNYYEIVNNNYTHDGEPIYIWNGEKMVLETEVSNAANCDSKTNICS